MFTTNRNRSNQRVDNNRSISERINMYEFYFGDKSYVKTSQFATYVVKLNVLRVYYSKTTEFSKNKSLPSSVILQRKLINTK